MGATERRRKSEEQGKERRALLPFATRSWVSLDLLRDCLSKWKAYRWAITFLSIRY